MTAIGATANRMAVERDVHLVGPADRRRRHSRGNLGPHLVLQAGTQIGIPARRSPVDDAGLGQTCRCVFRVVHRQPGVVGSNAARKTAYSESTRTGFERSSRTVSEGSQIELSDPFVRLWIESSQPQSFAQPVGLSRIATVISSVVFRSAINQRTRIRPSCRSSRFAAATSREQATSSEAGGVGCGVSRRERSVRL
jgi:hypothetical protein